jgi:phage terminase small subunit
MGKDSKLTPKQQLFIREYLKSLNATAAAKAAGYSEKTAEQQGCRLLRNVQIAEEVAKAQEKRCEKLEISADRVLQELALLGFANMMDYMTITAGGEAFVDLSKLTREQAAAIQEITVDETGGGSGDNKREAVQRTRFKLANKKDALELLGKHLKLFTEKIELTGDAAILQSLMEGRQRVAKHG